MTMRESIEFLKKDRRVNDDFMERLEEIGINIEYARYSYWNHQPYIPIGTDVIWLVEEKCVINSTSLINRMQNDVIRELKEKLEKEVDIEKNADKEVEEYFNSFD